MKKRKIRPRAIKYKRFLLHVLLLKAFCISAYSTSYPKCFSFAEEKCRLQSLSKQIVIIAFLRKALQHCQYVRTKKSCQTFRKLTWQVLILKMTKHYFISLANNTLQIFTTNLQPLLVVIRLPLFFKCDYSYSNDVSY